MKKIILPIFVLLLPFNVFAAPSNLGEVIDIFISLINNYLIPLVVALAVLYFLWNASKLVLYADNETERTKAGQGIIWGLIAIFVMVTLWALIDVLAGTFDINFGIPSLPEA